MKKILLTLICLQSTFMFSSNCCAQTPVLDWAVGFGGVDNEYGQSIAVDAFGNVYTTGYFSGTADFDPGIGTFNLTAVGGEDIFITKLDTDGNFLWAKSIGGTADDEVSSITLDVSGNIYVTGNYIGVADFDPGIGTFNLTAVGGRDIFIIKLDMDGNFLWAKSMGGTSHERGNAITTDALGNVYTIGYFQGVADFDPGAGISNLTATGGLDIFILKLDTNGNFIWVKGMGGTGSSTGNSIVIDALGNVYTTGAFQGTVDFNPGAGINNLTSAGSNDVFISKLDVNGNFLWAKSMGGPNQDVSGSISLDASGNVYTTGYFQGTADFNPGVGITNLISEGLNDIFISKLDVNGNFLWAKGIGGANSDNGSSILIEAGKIYIVGSFRETVDFDPGVGIYNLTSAGLADGFVLKLSTNGDFEWAGKIGGVESDSYSSVTISTNGDIYTTGYFRGTADFDPGVGTTNLTSSGATDIFVQKLLPCQPVYGTNAILSCGSYTWIDNIEYTTNNNTATYTIIGAASNGCDSIVTLNLIINQPTNSSVSVTECTSYTWGTNNQTYTTSGTYSHIIPNANNCDSTITLNLTITQPTNSSVSVTECTSYTWPVNNQIYTSSGVYTYIIPNTSNCDSTITLNLTINNVNATVALNGITLTANQSGATYQWIDCGNGNIPISGATSQSYTATANGSYAVIVTQNGCSVTSDCVVIATVGVEEVYQTIFSVYPNPNNGMFTIETELQTTITITNAEGKIISVIQLQGGQTKIDLGTIESGIYFINSLDVNGQKSVHKMNIIK